MDTFHPNGQLHGLRTAGGWLPAARGRSACLQSRAVKFGVQANIQALPAPMAWTPKRELATACYGRVSFFSGTNGKRRHKFEWQGSLVSMVLSPDGDVVACGSQDNTVHFWRRSTGRDSRMPGYSAKPSALAFNGRGTFLATGGSETITVWDFRRGPEGTEPRTLRLHGQPVTTLAFARSGKRLASASRDGSVVVWSIKKDGNGEPVGAAFLEDVGSALYWRPDGRSVATLDASGVVTVWRTS